MIKSISEFDNPEFCPDCKSGNVERYIARTYFYGASDWDNVQYNPGLGIVTRNAKHRAREAKARGLIEVGTESCDNIVEQNHKRREAELDSNFEESFKPVAREIKKAMEGNS